MEGLIFGILRYFVFKEGERGRKQKHRDHLLEARDPVQSAKLALLTLRGHCRFHPYSEVLHGWDRMAAIKSTSHMLHFGTEAL